MVNEWSSILPNVYKAQGSMVAQMGSVPTLWMRCKEGSAVNVSRSLKDSIVDDVYL